MPVRQLALAVLVAPMMVLAGCGGAPNITPKPTASATPAAPKIGPGTVLTDALEDAQCRRGEKPGTRKTWTARGEVKNTTDKTQDFEVLIYVGPAGGDSVGARLVKIKDLAKDKSADWKATGIKPADVNGPCYIRVRIAPESED